MTSKKIIERLQKGGWCIFVSTDHEIALVLNACIDSNIKWLNDIKASDLPIEFYLDEFIGCSYGMNILTHDSEYVFSENITDWFFSEINKGDDLDRGHLHNILDAWLDGDIIQSSHKNEEIWGNQLYESGLILDKDRKYRIKPNQTPLSIPNGMWDYISLNLKYAVMDKDGHIFFYEEEPVINKKNNSWCVPTGAQSGAAINVLQINTYGIDWELSLTKRPEGL